MENRSHAIAAGLFVIVLGLALLAAAKWLGGETVVRDPYLLVSTGTVSGLNPQSAVRYRGVDVGKVQRISFDPKDTRNILISIAVDRSVTLTQGVFAQLGYQGVTGLAYVQLDDDGKQPKTLVTTAENPARIVVHPSMFDKLSISGQDLLGASTEAVKRVNLLLGDQNQARISRMLESVEGASNRLGAMASHLEPGLKKLPELATDAGLTLKRADQLFAHLDQLAVRVNQSGGALDQFSDALPKFQNAGAGLTRNTRGLDRVLTQIEDEPQSLLFGKKESPGPGEAGFVAPNKGGGAR